MKVAILAGGLGSRLLEETRVKSKAMVPIGDQPILWHILKHYEAYGFAHFVIALGYQGDSIRSCFQDLGARRPPIVDGDRIVVFPAAEPGWTVELIETGLATLSGGRIKRLAPYLDNAPFMLTWCDGLSDVDLHQLRAFHEGHGRIATLTAIHPPSRFGRLTLADDRVVAFREKDPDAGEWINGAFFVLNPEVFDYIAGDQTQFEQEPLARLAADGQLMAYRHRGFWQCMDTLPEAQLLTGLWEEGAAPWKVWEEPCASC
jgi:glucose-1-phosphate cytidylyltransferase